MVEKARRNASLVGLRNVEFLHAGMEKLPLPDSSVDVVRHPGYVAGALFCVGVALSLGSVWALVPAGLASALLVLRTRWEDQTLQAELPGYKEYTRRVRFRMIPGLW
jgi:protein-S-isoprenylcysteine O-methyltransferase Ste14